MARWCATSSTLWIDHARRARRASGCVDLELSHTSCALVRGDSRKRPKHEAALPHALTSAACALARMDFFMHGCMCACVLVCGMLARIHLFMRELDARTHSGNRTKQNHDVVEFWFSRYPSSDRQSHDLECDMFRLSAHDRRNSAEPRTAFLMRIFGRSTQASLEAAVALGVALH